MLRLMACLVGVASGCYAFRRFASHAPRLLLHLGAAGVFEAVLAAGVSLISVAITLLLLVLARLVWRAGKRAIDTAETHDDTVDTFQLMATTLIKVLRVWKGQKSTSVAGEAEEETDESR